MRFPAASAFLALLTAADEAHAASFFKTFTPKFGIASAENSVKVVRKNGWFMGSTLRGGSTGKLSNAIWERFLLY